VRALFDVNVLIALFDPAHVHHESAHAWWKANQSSGWATCPLTENGFVRVLRATEVSQCDLSERSGHPPARVHRSGWARILDR
jgi:predicted nucleic acid-binding protein